jgi:hypothetical protein
VKDAAAVLTRKRLGCIITQEGYNIMFLLKKSKVAKEIEESGKYPDATILDIRRRDLEKGIRLHDSNYYFVIHETVIVELPIKSDDKSADDDKYILFSTDEDKSYYQELTIKDNKLPYGDKIMLEFLDPLPDLNYSLKVDLGADGASYFVFEDVPYKKLIEEKQ